MTLLQRRILLSLFGALVTSASQLLADAPTTKADRAAAPATKPAVASMGESGVRSLFDQLHRGMATSPREAYTKCWDVRSNCANALGTIWYSLNDEQRDRLARAQLGLLLAPLEGETLRDQMPNMRFEVITVEEVTRVHSDHRPTFVVKTKMSVPSGERHYLTTYVVQQNDEAGWKIVDSQSDSPMSVQLLLAQRWSEAISKKADPLASFEKFVAAIRGYTKAPPM